MEMNPRSYPKGVCEKIFRVIAFGPSFATVHRSITTPTQPPTTLQQAPTQPLPNSVKLASPHFTKPADNDQGAAVPIKFVYSTTTSFPTPTDKPKKEEAKKLTKKYASFDEFIQETRKRIMSDEEEEEDLDKVVVEFDKNHRFSK